MPENSLSPSLFPAPPFKLCSLSSSMVRRQGTTCQHQPRYPSRDAGLCTPTSLFSVATFHTAGKLPDFNLGSCNIHSVATSFMVSGRGVPQSKGEGGRINDCSHELFSTLAIPEDVGQLRPRKNINTALFIHRLFVHSSNSKAHKKEQSILYLT